MYSINSFKETTYLLTYLLLKSRCLTCCITK